MISDRLSLSVDDRVKNKMVPVPVLIKICSQVEVSKQMSRLDTQMRSLEDLKKSKECSSGDLVHRWMDGLMSDCGQEEESEESG